MAPGGAHPGRGAFELLLRFLNLYLEPAQQHKSTGRVTQMVLT